MMEQSRLTTERFLRILIQVNNQYLKITTTGMLGLQQVEIDKDLCLKETNIWALIKIKL